MNESFHPLLRDDPRITSYALGELEGDEFVFVDATVKADPELQKQVEEIRAATGLIEVALLQELSVAQEPAAKPKPAMKPKHRGKLLVFPQLYFVVSGVAAACFAVLVAVYQARGPGKTEVRRINLNLAAQSPTPEPPAKPAAEVPDDPATTITLAFPESPLFVRNGPLVGAGQSVRQGFASSIQRTVPMGDVRLSWQAPQKRSVLKYAQHSDSVMFASAIRPAVSGLGSTLGKERAQLEERPAFGQKSFVASEVSEASALPAKVVADSYRVVRLGATTAPAEVSLLDPQGRLRSLPLTQTFSGVEPGAVVAVPLSTRQNVLKQLRESLDKGEIPNPNELGIGALVDSFSYRGDQSRVPTISLTETEPKALFVSMEVSEAPWSPKHKLAWIRVEASRWLAGGKTSVEDGLAQLEFNPQAVAAYRLLGYNHGSTEAGMSASLAAGKGMSMLVELIPNGEPLPSDIELSRFTRPKAGAMPTGFETNGLLSVHLSWRSPQSKLLVDSDHILSDGAKAWEEVSEDFRFAASVAAFGMLLSDTPNRGAMSYAQIETWAGQGIGNSFAEERRAFIGLVGRAKALVR